MELNRILQQLAARSLRYRYLKATGSPGRTEAMSLEVTQRCIAKCLMCNIWQMPVASPELEAVEWLKLLQSPILSELKELDVTGGRVFPPFIVISAWINIFRKIRRSELSPLMPREQQSWSEHFMSFNVGAVALLTILLTLVISAVVMLVRSMFTATRGRKIPPYREPRSAVVVLDLQEGYSGTNSRQPVTIPPGTGLISVVNRLIQMAAQSDMEVAYIRQVFGNNLFVRLHGGKKQGKVVIDRRIKIINGNDFEKNRTDAFSNRQFEQLLRDRQVDQIFLVGVDAAFCVYYTALGALNRGYKVTVVTDAVMSRCKMEGVVAKYERKGIGIITSEELIREKGRSQP